MRVVCVLVCVQLSVHQAADVAATVSSKGALALWSLAPITLLPLQPQQQQQLPASWQRCSSCCWITLGGASAAAAAIAAGVSGLPLLLAVYGEQGIDVCLMKVSQHQQRQGGSMQGSGSSRQQGVYVSGVQVIAHLGLPAGISHIKQLQELAAVRAVTAAAEDGDGEPHQQQFVLQTALLGLGSSLGIGASQQQRQQQWPVRRLSGEAPTDGSAAGHDAWVSWTLKLSLQQPTTAAAAADPGSSSGWSLLVSPPNTTSSICSSNSSSSPTVAAAAMQEQQLSSCISCLHCPSPASPFMITGDASGHIMFWQVTQNNSSDPSGSTNQQGATHLNQGLSGSEGSGPQVELVQSCSCEVGGVDLGGICVAVALCTTAGYAAAAITCGQVG